MEIDLLVMYRLGLFICIVWVLPVWSSPAVNYTSISNRASISEEEQIQALENGALLEGDLMTPKENSTENRSGEMHSVRARPSPRWPNAIINFKLDKRFYGKFSKISNVFQQSLILGG